MDTTKDAFEDGILDHHLSLKQSIAAILQLAQNGSPIPPAKLLSLAQTAQETVGSTQKLLSDNLSTSVYNRRTTTSSSAVLQKTFAIPEMLELILERVAHSTTLEQLLEVRLVCGRFNQSIMGSVKLQRVLGLAPFDDQYFRATLQFQPKSKAVVRTYEVDWYRTAMPINLMEFSVRFYSTHTHKDVMPNLSACSIWGRMSICQPPLQEINCTYQGVCRAGHTLVAKDDGFLTVRDLHEAAKTIRYEHRHCCEMEDIVFKKLITLLPDDPLIAERRRIGLRLDKCKKDKWTRGFDLNYPEYAAVRATAQAAGLPLPTRQEYHASLGENVDDLHENRHLKSR